MQEFFIFYTIYLNICMIIHFHFHYFLSNEIFLVIKKKKIKKYEDKCVEYN